MKYKSILSMNIAVCLLLLHARNTNEAQAVRIYAGIKDDEDYDFYKDNGYRLDNDLDSMPVESLLQ